MVFARSTFSNQPWPQMSFNQFYIELFWNTLYSALDICIISLRAPAGNPPTRARGMKAHYVFICVLRQKSSLGLRV